MISVSGSQASIHQQKKNLNHGSFYFVIFYVLAEKAINPSFGTALCGSKEITFCMSISYCWEKQRCFIDSRIKFFVYWLDGSEKPIDYYIIQDQYIAYCVFLAAASSSRSLVVGPTVWPSVRLSETFVKKWKRVLNAYLYLPTYKLMRQ